MSDDVDGSVDAVHTVRQRCLQPWLLAARSCLPTTSRSILLKIVLQFIDDGHNVMENVFLKLLLVLSIIVGRHTLTVVTYLPWPSAVV